MPTSHISDPRALITMLCREAGDILRTAFNDRTIDSSSEAVTRFTELELRLMYLVSAFVRQYFPEHRVFGEDHNDSFEGLVWVCDPIDGTYFFTSGIPLYSFSISLLQNGEPILAAVYDPMTDRLFFAEKGKGAQLNGNTILIPANPTLNNRLVVISGGHGELVDIGGLHNTLRKNGAKVVASYSIVQLAAMVACGDVAAAIYGGTYVQDAAAITLIVREACGMVTNLLGEEVPLTAEIKGFIACTEDAHGDLQKLVSSFVSN